MLKRLSIIFLAFALVASVTMQLMPRALAADSAPCDMMNMKADTAPAGAPEMPCKGAIPVCSDSIGCAVFIDLPTPPQTAAIAVQWIQVVWSSAQSTLAGLTLEPELTPPIAIV